MAVDTAHAYGRRVNAHTRSIGGSKACLKAGVDMLYHCEYSDDELLDLFEANKDRVFVAPTVSLFHTIHNNEAAGIGLTSEIGGYMGTPGLLEPSAKNPPGLRKRGLRHLIGVAYGYKWSPNGSSARHHDFSVRSSLYKTPAARCCTNER